MKKVYTTNDPLLSGFLRGVLEDNQVACLIKNEALMGATGELPAQETWPEVWVLDDREEALAKRLIEHAIQQHQQEKKSAWLCSQCGEKLEGQFTHCWRCASARPQEE